MRIANRLAATSNFGGSRGSYTLNLSDFSKNNSAPIDKPIVATFSTALNEASVENTVQLKRVSSTKCSSYFFIP
jgi:hypothetical protein